MRIKLDTQGLDDYMERLARAGQDVDQVADECLAAAGDVLYPEILSRVPVDTGTLKEHIVVNGPFQDGNVHYLYVELDMRDREKMLYGIFVEFGTPYMSAQSYMYTGFAAGRKRALSAMQSIFEKAFAS